MKHSFSKIPGTHFFWLILLPAAILVNSALLSNCNEQVSDHSIFLTTYDTASATLIKNDRTIATGMKRKDPDTTTIAAEYNFPGLNNDQLTLDISIPRSEVTAYRNNYGYRQSELDALADQRQAALDQAYRYAVDYFQSQDKLDATSAKINREYDKAFRSFLEKRGFKFISSDLVTPDMPGIVKRNVTHLKPVALALNQFINQRDYDSDDIVPTVLTLVQTALAYRTIPEMIDQRHTAGIYPPLVTLTEGAGDCDSKTALLASILLNWGQIRLIGVGVPNHYLMGVMKNPAKGDLYIEYQGMPYVLIEPAGPAWLPPGAVSEYTLQILNSGDELLIEPLTI